MPMIFIIRKINIWYTNSHAQSRTHLFTRSLTHVKLKLSLALNSELSTLSVSLCFFLSISLYFLPLCVTFNPVPTQKQKQMARNVATLVKTHGFFNKCTSMDCKELMNINNFTVLSYSYGRYSKICHICLLIRFNIHLHAGNSVPMTIRMNAIVPHFHICALTAQSFLR